MLDTLTRFPLLCSFGDITKHHLRWIHVLSGSMSKYQRSVWYIWIYLILSFVTATAVQHKYCACIMNSKKSVMYIWNSMHLSSQKCLTLQKMAKKLYFIWTCQPKVQYTVAKKQVLFWPRVQTPIYEKFAEKIRKVTLSKRYIIPKTLPDMMFLRRLSLGNLKFPSKQPHQSTFIVHM